MCTNGALLCRKIVLQNQELHEKWDKIWLFEKICIILHIVNKRIIAEGIIGLALIGAAGVGIAGWYSEHERVAQMESEIAGLQKDQRRSVVLRSISSQMEDIAFQQKEISDEQREEALQPKRMADDMRQSAELERQNALEAQHKAVVSEQQAQEARHVAARCFGNRVQTAMFHLGQYVLSGRWSSS